MKVHMTFKFSQGQGWRAEVQQFRASAALTGASGCVPSSLRGLQPSVTGYRGRRQYPLLTSEGTGHEHGVQT